MTDTSALVDGLRRAGARAPRLVSQPGDDPTYEFLVSGQAGWVIVSDFDGSAVGRFSVLVPGRWTASPELFRWAATHTSAPTFGALSTWIDDDTGDLQFRVAYRVPLGLLSADDVTRLVQSMAAAAADAEANLSRHFEARPERKPSVSTDDTGWAI